MNELVIELERDHAVATAKRLYDLPGVCSIITSPKLMKAIAHGKDVTIEADQKVRLEIRSSAMTGIDKEQLQQLPGVKTVSGNHTLHEVIV